MDARAPEQARSELELRGDLQHQIGAHDSIQRFELTRQHHCHAQADRLDGKVEDPSS
jgi:hypothetical protein